MKIENWKLLNNKWFTIVVITAEWDMPWKALIKYIRTWLPTYKNFNVDINLIIIPVDDNIAKYYWINSVPYTIFFSNEKPIDWYNVLGDSSQVLINLETILRKKIY